MAVSDVVRAKAVTSPAKEGPFPRVPEEGAQRRLPRTGIPVLRLRPGNGVAARPLLLGQGRTAPQAVAPAAPLTGAVAGDARKGIALEQSRPVTLVTVPHEAPVAVPRSPADGPSVAGPLGGIVIALVPCIQPLPPPGRATTVGALATVAAAVAQRRKGAPAGGPRSALAGPLTKEGRAERTRNVVRQAALLLVRVGRKPPAQCTPAVGRAAVAHS